MRMNQRSQVAAKDDKNLNSDKSGTILINDHLFTPSEDGIPVVLTESSSEAAVSRSLQHTASPYKTETKTGVTIVLHSDTDEQ